jgi:hypothetical protein
LAENGPTGIVRTISVQFTFDFGVIVITETVLSESGFESFETGLMSG